MVTEAEVCQETNLGCIASIAQPCSCCIKTRAVNFKGVAWPGGICTHLVNSKSSGGWCLIADIQNMLNRNEWEQSGRAWWEQTAVIAAK